MHEPAKEPNDLERFFVERANAGDLEGLVALYESDATIACDGRIVTGTAEIRVFLAEYLRGRPQNGPSNQVPALVGNNLALTSSRLINGDVTAEVARRQPDGSWLWVIDNFAFIESRLPNRSP